MIYILLFLFLLVPVIRYDLLAKQGGEKVWYYTSLLLLIIVAGFRYRVGCDTLIYMAEYNTCPKWNELAYFDFETARYNRLWYVFCAACRSVTEDFLFFQVVHAIIVNCSFFHFFRKYCPNYYFSAILVWFVGFWCNFNMDVLREVLSVSMLLWATDWLFEKKYLRYYIVCVICMFMHYSSVVMFFLPLAFLIFRRPNCLLLIIILPVVIALTRIINIPNIIANVLSLNDQLVTVLENYIEQDQKNLTGIIVDIIKFIPVLAIVWFRQINLVEDELNLVPIISFVVFITGLSTYVGVFSRFFNYISAFYIIALVNSFYQVATLDKLFENRKMYVMVASLSVLIAFSSYINNYVKDRSDIYPNTRMYTMYAPYHSVLNPISDNKRESFVENWRDIALF